MQWAEPSPRCAGLAHSHDKPGEAKRGMVLPFQPLSMAFHNVWYAVDVPKVRGNGPRLDVAPLGARASTCCRRIWGTLLYLSSPLLGKVSLMSPNLGHVPLLDIAASGLSSSD